MIKSLAAITLQQFSSYVVFLKPGGVIHVLGPTFPVLGFYKGGHQNHFDPRQVHNFLYASIKVGHDDIWELASCELGILQCPRGHGRRESLNLTHEIFRIMFGGIRGFPGKCFKLRTLIRW